MLSGQRKQALRVFEGLQWKKCGRLAKMALVCMRHVDFFALAAQQLAFIECVSEFRSFSRICLPLGCFKELSLKLISMRCAEGSYDVMELDAMEILAEHTHFCEICNKGERSDRWLI